MQIKIITCHDVYNHGASLQAYALQTYLLSMGHEVEIIDYKPDYLSGHYKLWSVANPIYEKPIIKQLYLLAKLPGRLLTLKRKRLFDKFTRDYLKLTNHRYHSLEELKLNPPQADVYIAGSDQIWNTMFQNGRDAAFYLDFAPKDSIRVAYAASFAVPSIDAEFIPFVKCMLDNIKAISLRERISLPLLESLGRKDGIAVCDPVFLLEKKDWERLMHLKPHGRRYILVYDCEQSELLRDIALKVSGQLKLPIYNVSASSCPYAKNDFWDSSPIDFIELVHNSDYVVTNSFHAVAFSFIFQRDFCVTRRSEHINERLTSILEDYSLMNRMVSSYSADIMNHIDYSKIDHRLKESILESKEFLKESIG